VFRKRGGRFYRSSITDWRAGRSPENPHAEFKGDHARGLVWRVDCSMAGIMSLAFRNFDHSVVVRSAAAEIVGGPTAQVRLLADSSATGGALSTVRVTLEKGADGARPHRHDRAAEMFYVLDGVVKFLSGTEIVRAEPGDVIVVPPRLPHAFSAERGRHAELLIVIAPGVERFEYFRQLTRIGRGEVPPESLRHVQDLYDTYFLDSPEWEIESQRTGL
jgi:mannose-6-phosphate isomerase-like protein (cupin superfamily)